VLFFQSFVVSFGQPQTPAIVERQRLDESQRQAGACFFRDGCFKSLIKDALHGKIQ